METVVAALLGLRGRTELAAVLAVNLVTNPPLSCLILGEVFWPSAAAIALAEATVIIVETVLLKYALPRRGWLRLWVVALAMNVASVAAGFLLL